MLVKSNRFYLKQLILGWLHWYFNILMAPIYFHFGNHWFFLDTMMLLSNAVDSVGLYFGSLLFIIVVVFYRNKAFQSFVKNFYKNYLSFSNFLPLSIYVSFFFNNIFKIISFLINKIYFFIKK